MAAAATPNPLVSTTRASDTSPEVQLHPLVLLTISDYITRHTLRQQQEPIVGAILGQQNGREVTMEVAFECKLIEGENGQLVLDDPWFNDRLEQFKDVHKVPALDLVGWFTIGPPSGPLPHFVPIHEQLQIAYNEAVLLLLFHPSDVAEEFAAGGKLPLTLYESVLEAGGSGDKSSMEIDGATHGKQLRFKELGYTIETGEAEMISVDFVARGGGNATAVDGTKVAAAAAAAAEAKDGKGKAKGKSKEEDEAADSEETPTSYLSADDEDLLSSLTAKSNAIKMLHRRIHLLQAYLASLPLSHLSDASISTAQAPPELNHSILRSISALLARIPLLVPANTDAFARESLEEKSDVSLVTLLASITGSIFAANEAGKKLDVVEKSRYQKSGGQKLVDPEAGGSMGFFDTVMGGMSSIGRATGMKGSKW